MNIHSCRRSIIYDFSHSGHFCSGQIYSVFLPMRDRLRFNEELRSFVILKKLKLYLSSSFNFTQITVAGKNITSLRK